MTEDTEQQDDMTKHPPSGHLGHTESRKEDFMFSVPALGEEALL